MKERHLDGTALIKSGGNAGGGGSVVFEPLARPDLLITDAERTLMIVPRRKDRDAILLGMLYYYSTCEISIFNISVLNIETITSTLEDARKSVLMPCDTSARLLELLLMLDQHWQFARLRAPICLVSRTGKEMINLVRSLVEWMGGSTGLEDDETGTATLKLRWVYTISLCHIQSFMILIYHPCFTGISNSLHLPLHSCKRTPHSPPPLTRIPHRS